MMKTLTKKYLIAMLAALLGLALGISCIGIFAPRENVSAILLDTGTGISPLVPWSATSIFVSGTLGYASLDYCLFAPILWLAVVIYPAVGFIQWKKKRRLSAFSDRAGHKE